MATAMAMAAVLLLFVLAAPVVHSVQYSVSWDVATSYGSWATKKLYVGDVLDFTYISEMHSVDVVDATDYASCKTGNPLASFTGGESPIPLTAPGPMYFICPTAGHCQGGMKLSVTVSAAATPPTAPKAAPPASTNTTATPSPSPTTTLTLSPSPSPSVSPSPAVTSPTGSPASAPSPATTATSTTANSPESSSGARSMVAIGFSVVVAGLAGFMV